jgi:hypothetical protein
MSFWGFAGGPPPPPPPTTLTTAFLRTTRIIIPVFVPPSLLSHTVYDVSTIPTPSHHRGHHPFPFSFISRHRIGCLYPPPPNALTAAFPFPCAPQCGHLVQSAEAPLALCSRATPLCRYNSQLLIAVSDGTADLTDRRSVPNFLQKIPSSSSGVPPVAYHRCWERCQKVVYRWPITQPLWLQKFDDGSTWAICPLITVP